MGFAILLDTTGNSNEDLQVFESHLEPFLNRGFRIEETFCSRNYTDKS